MTSGYLQAATVMEPTPNTPPFHSAIRALEPFIGTWVGEGIGFYPTIKVFKYGEEAVFSTWGKPIVSYSYVSHLLARSSLIL